MQACTLFGAGGLEGQSCSHPPTFSWTGGPLTRFEVAEIATDGGMGNRLWVLTCGDPERCIFSPLVLGDPQAAAVEVPFPPQLPAGTYEVYNETQYPDGSHHSVSITFELEEPVSTEDVDTRSPVRDVVTCLLQIGE